MKVVVVTPPAPVVSLAEAKKHIGVLHDDDDTLIGGYVATATSMLDGPDGWLGRALGVQVVKTTLRGFPDEPFVLPLAPVSAINDVTYLAADGSAQDLDPAVYDLSAEGEFELAYNAAWPALRDPRAPIEILYTAGYEVLPDSLRVAILIMTADLYANRESGGVGSIAFEYRMPTSVEGLAERFRFWRV
jgi:uncharacterized phiE125 gp8 family phage protein